MRTLVIGDIHGCYRELQALLDQAALSDDDTIISIGDMVNRGPHNAQVLDFFRNSQARVQAIMGNHEWKHVRAHQGKRRPRLATLLTRWQFGTDYAAAVDYMASLPAYLDLPEALLVHAYWEPGRPLNEQEHRVLVGTSGAENDLNRAYDRPWYELYDGEKPLIVGHRDWSGVMKPFIYQDRVWGIDTRCVYGGSLTGLLLPDFKLISVPARHDHYAKFLKRYAERDYYQP